MDLADEKMISLIGGVVISGYAKVPKIGPRARLVADTAARLLGNSEHPNSIETLAELLPKIRNPTGKKKISALLEGR